MKILMVAERGYVRILREALALKSKGHEVSVLCAGDLWGREHLDGFGLFHGREQLQRAVQASQADVLHVFNEPDVLVPIVKGAAGERPVVFDVQDLQSLRTGEEPDELENEAFQAADGVVHVSGPCRLAAEAKHGKKPGATLACYVNEGFYAKDPPRPCWQSVVYEGGLALSTGDSAVGNIRGLEPVVQAFAQAGFEVHLYPAGQPPPRGAYENLGAVVHGGLSYPVLLRALRVYGFGFVGAPFSTPLMEAALPNKLFEYMSQGVVPVCLNAGTAARFVESEGIGIALSDLYGLLGELLPRGKQCRKRLLQKRWEWTMESQIERLVSLYEEVLG